MNHTQMNAPNRVPAADGDFTWYLTPWAQQRPGSGTRDIVFVNGAATPAEVHKKVAFILSDIIEGNVLGIYNQTGTLNGWSFSQFIRNVRNDPVLGQYTILVPGTDVAAGAVNTAVDGVVGLWNATTGQSQTAPQAAPIKADLRIPLTATLEALAAVEGLPLDVIVDVGQLCADWGRIMLALQVEPTPVGQFLRANPLLVRRLIEIFFIDNVAVRELIAFLDENIWGDGVVPIVCHSQGNLVVASAMHGLAVLRNYRLPRAIKIYAVASPVPGWPTVTPLVVRNYVNALDWAPLFSLGASYTTNANFGVWKGGFMQVHDLEPYIANTDFNKELRRDLGLPPPPQRPTNSMLGVRRVPNF